MKTKLTTSTALLATLLANNAIAMSSSKSSQPMVSDQVVAEQRANLQSNTQGLGFGPQSPRDLETLDGDNPIVFGSAPPFQQMNLCNIHFHKNAEHKGGEFTTYAGNGDGHGYQTGYVYDGKLNTKESKPLKEAVCKSEHSELQSGDTIELHYVHSSASISPGPTLGACLSESIKNPQLRVEAQVFVLVNDAAAQDFATLTKHSVVNGYHQATHIPSGAGTPVVYQGSTTGPSYNEAGSPLQVTWSVRPKVIKVNIESVGAWCEGNTFNEDHAHGVRNLVVNPLLISPIDQ